MTCSVYIREVGTMGFIAGGAIGLGPVLLAPLLSGLGIISGAVYSKVAFACCNYIAMSALSTGIAKYLGISGSKSFPAPLLIASLAAPTLSRSFLMSPISYFESCVLTLVGLLFLTFMVILTIVLCATTGLLRDRRPLMNILVNLL